MSPEAETGALCSARREDPFQRGVDLEGSLDRGGIFTEKPGTTALNKTFHWIFLIVVWTSVVH